MKQRFHISLVCLLPLAALLFGAWVAAACDDLIYDDEGDCSATYIVDFTYSYNLLHADAFAAEVDEVHLYVLHHATGQLATRIDAVADKTTGGSLQVTVPAGCYDLVAWCTGKAPSDSPAARLTTEPAFVLPSDGAATRGELGTTLRRNGDGEVPQVVERLFHGCLLGVEFPAAEGTHRFTVPLVKDTNTLRVVLQHLNGSTVTDAEGFDFTVTDSNGRLAWDNSLLADDRLTYRPWSIDTYAAQTSDPDNPDAAIVTTTFSALAAEFTLSRLVSRTDGAPVLRIRRRSDGGTVLSFPVVELALLLRSKAYAGMSAQEFLDRQDTYDCVFFLDERDRWVDTHIFINSWVIVLQNEDL